VDDLEARPSISRRRSLCPGRSSNVRTFDSDARGSSFALAALSFALPAVRVGEQECVPVLRGGMIALWARGAVARLERRLGALGPV
jgi:hypothetical protein